MRLAKLSDRKPVKIGLSLKVQAYVDVYRVVYGEAEGAAATDDDVGGALPPRVAAAEVA